MCSSYRLFAIMFKYWTMILTYIKSGLNKGDLWHHSHQIIHNVIRKKPTKMVTTSLTASLWILKHDLFIYIFICHPWFTREMLHQLTTYWTKKVVLWLLHFFHMEFLHEAWTLILRSHHLLQIRGGNAFIFYVESFDIWKGHCELSTQVTVLSV